LAEHRWQNIVDRRVVAAGDANPTPANAPGRTPPAGKGCYCSFWFNRNVLIQSMPYRVIALTMAQVRQGALGFQRELSAVLREHPEIKVFSVSPFDLDERRRFKDRFGGDIVYFLNDAAFQECERLGLNLQLLAEISDDELPRRRSLVVGTPERRGGTPV
jgi:hypothetical protein